MAYYLRVGGDTLEQAERHRTKGDAVAAYAEAALELDRYGQKIEASIHISDRLADIDEYPDFVLSLGPRGGVRCERT